MGGAAVALGALGLGTLILAVACVRHHTLVQATAWSLIVLLGLSMVRAHQQQASPLARLAVAQAMAELVVTVRGDPHVSPTTRFGGRTVTAVVEVSVVEGRGAAYAQRQQALLSATGESAGALEALRVGTRARVSVRLAPTDTGPLVAYASLRAPPRVVAPPGPWAAAAEAVRGGLRDAVSGLPAQQRALVPALVVGDTSQQTPEVVERFRTTGLTHLTAVSGANLTLLLAFLLTAAKWVGVRGRGLLGVGLAGVVIFVALCRTEPSVLRASAMGLVALAALGGHARPGKGARHLALAVLMLVLIDPWLGRSVGFALSVLASAGIIGWSAWWRDRMTWLPKPLAEAVTVPLAAQLATQPVVTAISGQVSMVGLVANALAGPFVGPATVLGFATAGLSLIVPLIAGFTGWLAGWCAQAIIWIAEVGSSFPGAAWAWPADPAGIAVVGVACVAGLIGGARFLASPWLSLVVTLAMIAVVLRPQVVPGWPPGDWQVVACDVGQGSATVLRIGNGQAVVVDTGGEPQALETCLQQLGIRAVPLLVLSHYHADHIDGRAAVLGRRPVGMVLVSPLDSPAALAARVRAEAAGLGIPVVATRPGHVLTVGHLRWRTLGPAFAPDVPPLNMAGESSVENDASIVALVDTGGVRVLLPGDVEPSGQQALLRAGADLRAEVLIVPHHGSARQDEAFIHATGTGIALVSAGEDNDYGHPAARTLHLLEKTGRRVARTDRQGSLAVGGTAQLPVLTTQRRDRQPE